MTYTETAWRAGDELASDDGDELAQAALQLALQAWQALAGDDPAWDKFGLELLAVRGRLYPTPTIVAVTAPPDVDQPDTRDAVTALVEALARRHQRVAGDASRSLVERLDHDGVAVQLRRAAAALA